MILHKTKGIVLHQIKYSDTSIIAYLYTETFGRQAYLIKGAHKKETPIRAAYFQPLYLVDMEVYHNPKKNLQTIKELRLCPALLNIANNPVKKTIALFLAEVLYKIVREENSDPKLFGYLYHAIQILEELEQNIANFHICFLIQLTSFLGFYPSGTFGEKQKYFDLLNGLFVSSLPSHNHYADLQTSKLIGKSLNTPINHPDLGTVSHIERYQLIEKIIEYYKIHLEGFGNISSAAILREVFHD